MSHPITAVDAATLAAHLPVQREAILRVLAHAIPPAATDEPYVGQECVGLTDAWRALYTLVRSTLHQGEGNSCLVMGEPGCGKSLVVESVLRHAEQQGTSQHPAPWIVRLSALLHPTDRQCLADMAKQLMAQGAIGRSDVDHTIAHVLGPEAETIETAEEAVKPDWDLTTAPEDDVSDEEEEETQTLPSAVPDSVAAAILASMSTTLAHILTLLTRTSSTSSHRPLVIVIDQFEQFAHRPRQALLYCLLDAVQASSYAPGMIVIGVTTRVDAPEFLEKRVKSRFSHRIVHVSPPSLDQYMILARTALLAGTTPDPSSSFATAWYEEVDQLLQDEVFRLCLQGLHELSGDVRLLYQSLVVPIAALTPSSPCLEATAFQHAMASQRMDTLHTFLLSLPVPDMTLLIAARHLQLREREPFTFEMCFYHISQFVQRAQRDMGQSATRAPLAIAGLARLAERATMWQAYCRLLEWELFLPEPARQSLALSSGIANRTGPATSPYGILPSTSVMPAFLPVRSQISAKAILDSVQHPDRAIPLSSTIVKWAESTGV